MRNIYKHGILFGFGGLTYMMLELLWRGESHVSMFLLGGICFLAVGILNEFLPWEMSLVKQSLIGAGIITALEFVCGLIVNVWLGLGVWDYSHLPFNVLGQICLPYFCLWIPAACAAILLDDYVRCGLFGEEIPHYVIF